MLRTASVHHHNEVILPDVTYMCDPQAGVHMRTGINSAHRDESAASSTSEARKRNHKARPQQVPFDECSYYKLATLAVKALGTSGRKAATWTSRYWPAQSEGRTDRPYRGKASAKNESSSRASP